MTRAAPSDAIPIRNGRGSRRRPTLTVERPALRYHGGKFVLARWIIPHMPPHRTYLEPFGGACSVLLQKRPCYAEVVTDLDLRVAEYFAVLRDPESYAALKRGLSYTPYHEDEFRRSLEHADDPIERARRFCVRSFMSHGSDGLTAQGTPGFRSSVTRAGTTPARDWASLPAQMDAIHERLREVAWLTVDAFDAIAKYAGDDTLIYADPPYHPATRSDKMKAGERYHAYVHEMDHDGHVRLLETLLDSPSMVMLSGYRCDLYDALLEGWTRYDKKSQMDGNARKVESLWLNPLAESRRPNPDLFGDAL